MKKTTLKLLIICTIFISSIANAQFSESFEGGIPGTWTIINGGDANTFEAGPPDFGTGAAHSGTNVAILAYDAIDAHDDYLVSPQFTVTANVTDRLSFWYMHAADIFPETFDVVLSTTGTAPGDFSTVIASDVTPLEAQWTSATYDLSAYVGQTVYIAFHSTTTNQFELYLDDVVVDGIPTCVEPNGITASAIGLTDATISWTAAVPIPATGYEYVVSTSNTEPAGAGTPTTALSVPVTGLSSSTNYYIFVRSNCGSGFSVWSAAVPFSTLCTSASVPYVQDFESAIIPAVPTCNSVVNNGAGNVWAVTNNPGSGFTSKTLQYSFNSSNPADTWFFTQGINLTAGTSYRIKYDYGNNSTFFPENLKVAYGLNPDVASMTNSLADHPGIASAAPVNNSIDFIPSADGVYYFGFNAYSARDEYFLFVDNINITVTPTCLEVDSSSLTMSNVTSTSGDISWDDVAGSVNYEYVLDQVAADPAGAGTSIATALYNATGLTPGTTYYFHVRNNCGAELSAWSTISFTTFPDCSVLTTPADAATAVPVVGSGVTLAWNAPAGPAPTGYNIYFGVDSSALPLLGNLAALTVNVTGVSYGTTYYWQAIPVNAGGEGVGCSMFSFTTVASPGYCLDAIEGQYPSGSFTPSACDGVTVGNVTPSSDGWASEYSVVNVVNGQNYQFESSVATDFITISADGGATAAAYGTTPLVWTSTIDGPVRFYTHTNDQCGAEEQDRNRTVICGVTLRAPSFDISGFSAYPNPVKDVLNLSYTKDISNVSVHNLLGQEVLNKSINAMQAKVDLSKLSNGTYLVKVTVDGLVKTIKVVKQ